MTKKLRVSILFGGKSGEHDVSLLSATSVMEAINLDQYKVIPIGIEKDGSWKVGNQSLQMLKGIMQTDRCQAIANQIPREFEEIAHASFAVINPQKIDVVFPVIHGTYGEDGKLQGLFEMAGIPYVGAGVLASALGMDKALSKKVFQQSGLPQAKYLSFHRKELANQQTEIVMQIKEQLGYPCFVKPANLGSSVGISKAMDDQELTEALHLAAKYDEKIVIEEFVEAREIEVAILGNDQPQASVPGEIISSNDFYDYKAKYVDGKSKMQIPADLSKETSEKIREMAIQAYQAIDGSGLSRVDFFVRKESEEILLNEINTMPGFTAFSMYSKLWEYTGVRYSELVSRLIELALERHQEKQALVTTYEVE